MKEFDLIIVGGGPAGLTAGIYGKRAELDLLVLDSGVGGGQIANAGLVENWPGFPEGIRGLDLAESFKKHAEAMGVRINMLEPVHRITKVEDLFLVESSKDKYRSKAVIVASGLTHKKLGVPGEDEFAGRGVSYCATCDGAFFKGKDVAVIGGGTGAAMAALNLADLARKIHVITRKKKLVVAEKIMETRISKLKNLELIPETRVKEILGRDKVTGLLTEKRGVERTLDVDGIFVEVGKTLKTGFLDDLGVQKKKGYLVTDDHQRTNVPGLYAAGDVAHGSIKQVTVAAAQGTIAALSAYEYIKTNF